MFYEIISAPAKYQILEENKVRAEVLIQLTDQDVQHARIYDCKNKIYYQSDFDISLTRVPGISRSVYYLDREVVRFIYQDIYSYRIQTCHEEFYTIQIHKETIDIMEDTHGKKVAVITMNPYNNHSHIQFYEGLNENLRLAMALFPCIRFI